ncbi:MAG TPA: NADH-quinone oxidoreductase subunit C [Terriglobales bacterium]|nr:NADH-quinone oxidoreductase subunit C [Terriglobales bacterium]
MPDETKGNTPPASPEKEQQPVSKPPLPSTPSVAKPAVTVPPKPTAPPPPPKPAGPVPVPWESEMVSRLRERFGSGIREASTYLGQSYMIVDRSVVYEVLQQLHDEEEFNYLVDCTATHYPQRPQPFEVIWILYSFSRNERIRVKTAVGDGEAVSSTVALWSTANWLEREVFDMFGIRFEGHPDLRRILLPEDWKGYPLRKDYSIIQQDREWVQVNLGIESGQ